MGKGARVLVVDDDAAIVDSIRRYLILEGFETVGALSGEEAIGSLRTTPPSVVVLDIMMPGMDGYEVLETMKKEFPNIPVIFITARTGDADVLTGWKSGADYYISKPFEMGELLHALDLVLGKLWKKGL